MQTDFGPWYETALARDGHGEEKGDTVAASSPLLCPAEGPCNNHIEQFKINTRNNDNASKSTACSRVLLTGNEAIDEDIKVVHESVYGGWPSAVD